MGALVSSAKSDDKKKIRDYEEDIDRNYDEGDGEAKVAILEADPRHSVRWYHWILYDIHFRVAYVTLLGFAIGIGIPLVFYFMVFANTESVKYGSCLINSEYRFQCLINSYKENPNEDDCHYAHGCFTDDHTIPFKCHHSFPPSYQYAVGQIQRNADAEVNELTLTPINPSTMSSLRLISTWQEDNHLELELFRDVSSTVPNTNLTTEQRPLLIEFGSQNEFFYVHILRHETGETIFDTRLGPVISDESTLSFSTVLPTKFFWGLKGGHSELAPVTHAVVNGPGSGDMPFYMALEKNGSFHGVLVETVASFMFQYIEAPGALFHFQNETAVKLHFFPGPTPQEVYAQVFQFKKTKFGLNPTLPPYWALGLHLCREGYNITEILDEILTLRGNSTLKSIPYDSDCIEQTLRQPFAINATTFPQVQLEVILNELQSHGQRLLLSQRMGLETYNDSTPLILNSEGSPLLGIYTIATNRSNPDNGTQVVFPDYMNDRALDWASAELSLGLDEPNATFHSLLGGLVLVDNFPETVDNLTICGRDSGVNSKLGMTYSDLGLICANALHQNNTMHLAVHNVFGQESLRVLRAAFEAWTAVPNQRTPLVAVSVWTGIASQDGFTGIQVPFTWTGLTESVLQIVRNFVMNPVLVGTPICGSFSTRVTSVDENDEETPIFTKSEETLCLRWFQLGLLLPFARNTKTQTGIPGPADFNLKHRSYLISNIESRYGLNPYYYTQLYEYQVNDPKPLIRPLVFDFYSSEEELNQTSTVTTQFMIGDALMAAPILSEATSRQVYFPQGVWYDLHGNLVTNATYGGRTLTVPSFLAEIPLYIREGYVIPILHEPIQGTAENTRNGSYALLGTYPTATNSTSNGTLFIDDGVSLDSVSTENFNYVRFSCTADEFKVIADPCTVTMSSTIDEIRIIGFPHEKLVRVIESTPPISTSAIRFTQSTDVDETGSLRFYNLDLDWCNATISEVTFRWIE